MATDARSSAPSGPAGARKQLLERIATFRDRPFQHEIVQSPWESVVDVEGLHQSVKQTILRLVETCGEANAARCLTVIAPSGYGKTHLLGWARQQLDDHDSGLFLYVPPYLADSGVVENFILRAAIDSLRHSSPRQSAVFGKKVREFLVEVYDRKVRHRKNWRHLGLRYGLLRWLWPSWQKIGDRPVEDQLLMLQQALGQRGFLSMAFAKFKELHPFVPPNARPDWDGFVAACLLACGDATQSTLGEHWINGKELGPPHPFEEPCQGQEKVRNIFFTLNRLSRQPFLLTFDQMEDMYAVFTSRGTKEKDFNQLGRFLEGLSYVPKICQVFMFQTSVWSNFVQTASQHLLDRMTATYGTQNLSPLDDDTAKALVRRRLQQFVWGPLGSQNTSQGDPYFPFNESEIPPLRQMAQGRLRDFLQTVRAAYCDKLVIQPPFTLTQIEPTQVSSSKPKQVVIKGENLPLEVTVYFGDKQATQVKSRPGRGEIEAKPPKGLEGSVEVRVVAPDGRDARIALHFLVEPIPQPYAKHLDRKKFRAKREELKETQKDVAAAVGTNQPYISGLELGKNNPPDELFQKLAAHFKTSLAEFLLDLPSK